jgi:hypothetical protein
MQAELRHDRELKEAQADAEAKLDESLKDYTDASSQLQKELEEETRLWKEAQARNATLTSDQAEYDRLVIQADTLAFSKPLFLFSFCLKASSFRQYVLKPVPSSFPFFLRRALPGLAAARVQEGGRAQG